MEKFKNPKVAFIHGRPSGHPTHAKYAKSVNSTFFHEDRLVRWQDQGTSKLRRYTSWIINSIFFPKLSSWDVILTECVRIPQLIQKKFNFLKKDQKLIALMSDESLYFTSAKVFPKLTRILMIEFWKNCDALICVGNFQSELAKSLLPEAHHSKIYTTFNGIPNKKLLEFSKVEPNLQSKTILFIGNISSIWRSEYKGLDLMISAFKKCSTKRFLKFKIVGDISPTIQKYLMKEVDPLVAKNIHFVGEQADLIPFFRDSSLYLHTARGEAWGISITEAIASGVPAIISDKTGVKEIVEEINPSFVIQLKEDQIIKSIEDYFLLNDESKLMISKRGREIIKKYSEEKAILNFQMVFEKILIDLAHE